MSTFDCLAKEIPLRGHHLIEASAGTGKTFAIEHLVVRMILKGVPINNILVMTFTRAATAELKQRVSRRLHEGLLGNLPYLTGDSLQKERIQRALFSIDHAEIHTLHGFCRHMLMTYPEEGGLPSLPMGEGEGGLSYLLADCLDLFRHSLPKDLFSDGQLFLFFQKGVIKRAKEVINSITQRRSFPPLPSFSDSFSSYQKAWQQLPPLSQTLFDEGKPWWNQMGKEGDDQQFNLLITEPTEEAFDQILKYSFPLPDRWLPKNRNRRKKGDPPFPISLMTEWGEALSPLIASARNPENTLARLASWCSPPLKGSLKKKEGATPDRFIEAMIDAIQHSPFLKKVREGYRSLIVDEFQDTDALQWKIIKTLFIDSPLDTLYLVGDPKQSIYGFRHADLNTYSEAAKQMDHHHQLLTNYRSSPSLLERLNALFSSSADWLSLPCPPLTAGKKGGRGELHAATLMPSEGKSKPSWNRADREWIAPWIAQEAQKLQKRGTPYADMAILVKDRFQGAIMAEALEKEGIPVAGGGGSLVESPSFSLLEALLRGMEDPRREAAPLLAHPLLPTPWPHPLFKNRVESWLHRCQEEAHGAGIARALGLSIHSSSPWGEPIDRLIGKRGGESSHASWRHLLTQLFAWTENHSPTLREAIAWLAHEALLDSPLLRLPEYGKEGLRLMTLHKSKGLEFPVVFAPALSRPQSQRPHWIPAQEKWVLSKSPSGECAIKSYDQERLRQLYVACTRAQETLYLFPMSWWEDSPEPYCSPPLHQFLAPLFPLNKLWEKIGANSSLILPQERSPSSPPPIHLSPPLPPFPALPSLFMTSFSHMAPQESITPPSNSQDSLPSGATTGNLLHKILEKAILQGPKEPIDPLIEGMLSKHPLAPHREAIETIIRAALRQPITPCGIRLIDIPRDHLFPEIEFLYQKEEELIHGWIDLAVQIDNQYYLVDWKSHHLRDYQVPSLNQAMEEGGYFLQASLYMEGVRQRCIQRGQGKSLAGMWYCFLRGLPKGEGALFIDGAHNVP
ncbi:MAG: UvrD-helicase domain-containing protein [Chlamydiota bacterium]|nr:UvrD-helicase domain-containing protein [Chlamydiota bacterium]